MRFPAFGSWSYTYVAGCAVEKCRLITGVRPSACTFVYACGSRIPTTYGTGVAGKSGAASWATNDTVGYRFTITRNDDTTVNAHVSATEASDANLTFTWEARNN